jgi:hypothetical protein
VKESGPVTSPRPEPRPALLWCLALLPVLAAYANVTSVGFMWDDHMLIEQNTDLHTLSAPWAYVTRSFWQHPFAYGLGHAFYRPLVTFTLAADWALGGGRPLFFHLTNVALHLVVCTLVFLFAQRRSGSGLTAAVVTMLFGVMPRLTESVTWIVGRTDVIATLLVLAALLLAESKKAHWAAGLALFFALLAKEVALIGGAALLAGAAVRVLRRETTLRDELAPLATTLLAVATWATLRSGTSSTAPLRLHDVQTFLAGVGQYTLMALTPWNPRAQIGSVHTIEGWAVATGALTVLVVAALAWRWLRSSTPWRAVWLAASLGGVVMVSLVALTVYTMASDRFLYLPLAFAAVVAAQRAWARGPLAVGVALALGLTVVTARRNELWAEPIHFWQEVHETASPLNPGRSSGLADALYDVSRLEEAHALFLEAEQVRGEQSNSPDRLSLAVIESKLGRDADALARLDGLVADNPKWKRAFYDRVLFRARALDFPGARTALADARSRFGDDDVLASFSTLLDAQEPKAYSEQPLERARALDALGAVRKAEAVYATLLDEPAARAESAQWLLVFASEPNARKALAVMADDPAALGTWGERFPALRETAAK